MAWLYKKGNFSASFHVGGFAYIQISGNAREGYYVWPDARSYELKLYTTKNTRTLDEALRYVSTLDVKEPKKRDAAILCIRRGLRAKGIRLD